MSGPLSGIRVVEVASIGPGPFAAMVLGGLGADVVRIDRPGSPADPSDPLLRGRAVTVALDLKAAQGVATAQRLADGADVLIEGFRPGVMERLGLGPDRCLAANPRLVYGRMTGWGQDGPRAATAGHDIDYLAVAGALHPIGPRDGDPLPPLNLVADFGGGGMLLVSGVLAALLERATSGRGQVVDAAMVDGVAMLMAMPLGMMAAGLWSDRRGDNLLDGGAPFYRTYRTADGRHVAVGALEPAFYAVLVDTLGLGGEPLPAQYDRSGWEVLHRRFAETFLTATRDEWSARFAGADACVVPVLTPDEAGRDPHLAGRRTLLPVAGGWHPAPAPRFSRSSTSFAPGSAPAAVLAAFGLTADEVDVLLGQ